MNHNKPQKMIKTPDIPETPEIPDNEREMLQRYKSRIEEARQMLANRNLDKARDIVTNAAQLVNTLVSDAKIASQIQKIRYEITCEIEFSEFLHEDFPQIAARFKEGKRKLKQLEDFSSLEESNDISNHSKIFQSFLSAIEDFSFVMEACSSAPASAPQAFANTMNNISEYAKINLVKSAGLGFAYAIENNLPGYAGYFLSIIHETGSRIVFEDSSKNN